MPSWYESVDENNAGTFFTEQVKELQKLGNDVTIAIVDILNYPYRSKQPKYQIIKEERHGIDVYRMVVPSLMTGHVPGVFFSYYAHYYKKLIKHLFSIGLMFDVMFAHSFWHAGYIGTLLKKEYNLPLIVQEHRSMLITGAFSGAVNKYLKATVTQADMFYCVSSKLRENIYIRTGLNDGIELLPNMVDDLFCYQPVKNNIFTYAFVGTLNENKRIIQLLRCFEKCYIDNPSIRLKVAGDGPLREQINEMVNTSDILRESVDILGFLSREEVFDLLSNANVLVLPSAFETFGIVCIESLAIGRPVICTKNGAVDFITGENGILIDVDSDDQLIMAMKEVYKNYNSYNLNQISEHCLENYSGKVIMSTVISKMAEVKSK